MGSTPRCVDRMQRIPFLAQSPANSSVALRPASVVRRRKSASSSSSVSAYSSQIWSSRCSSPSKGEQLRARLQAAQLDVPAVHAAQAHRRGQPDGVDGHQLDRRHPAARHAHRQGRSSASSAGGHVGGENVVGVAVEVLPYAVVAHGRAGSAWRAVICSSRRSTPASIVAAVAGSWCQDAGDECGRGRPAEGLAGSVVEAPFDGAEVCGGVDRQVGSFGEVLPQQSVGVLVASAARDWPGRRGRCRPTAATQFHAREGFVARPGMSTDQAQVEQSHRGRPSLLADHRELPGEMSTKIPRISSMTVKLGRSDQQRRRVRVRTPRRPAGGHRASSKATSGVTKAALRRAPTSF